MVPLIELRGAIPIAQSMGLPIMTSYLVCIVGNMIPVPFIYLFARKVLEWGADKPVIGRFFTFCLEKGRKGGRKLTEKAGSGIEGLVRSVHIRVDRRYIEVVYARSEGCNDDEGSKDIFK